MAKPELSVTVFFGTTATGAGIFTLNSSLLDGPDVLGGDIGTDVTADVETLSIRRGRPSQLYDVFDPATGTAGIYNDGRDYDPFNTAGTYFGFFKPGLPVSVEANGITIFEAKVADWNYEYTLGGPYMATMELEDALAVLGRQQFDEWTTTASQTAGDRFTDILNRPEVGWSGGARDLDTGVTVLQADLVTWGSNVLNYAQLVGQSDLGAFFASREGLITFRDRHANIGATPSVVFADDGTGIIYKGIGSTVGAETFYTRVSVDREGGTAQTYVVADAEEDGIRSLPLSGLLMDTDAQALDMATFLANVYSTGDPRISMIRVPLDDDNLLTVAEINEVLSLDLYDPVDVTFTPGGVGDPITQTSVVQGIDHDITASTHTVTLWLSRLDQANPFILDSSLLDGTDVLTF